MSRIVLAGGSGFVGRMLSKMFLGKGWNVTVLTRADSGSESGIEKVHWDAMNPGEWVSALEGADVLVNLAGHSLQCLHTRKNREKIINSRVDSVKALVKALNQCREPPPVYLQSSASGYYGTEAGIYDEQSPSGSDFLAQVCREWESAFSKASLPGIRRTVFRMGVVLSADGGMLPVIARLARWFLGGAAGSGRQMISWVHEQDLQQMIMLAATSEAPAVFNAVSPNPVSNAEFMRLLRKVLNRPWSPPVPKPAIWLGGLLAGIDPRMILKGQAVVPRYLQGSGFSFLYPELEPALRDLLSP